MSASRPRWTSRHSIRSPRCAGDALEGIEALAAAATDRGDARHHDTRRSCPHPAGAQKRPGRAHLRPGRTLGHDRSARCAGCLGCLRWTRKIGRASSSRSTGRCVRPWILSAPGGSGEQPSPRMRPNLDPCSEISRSATARSSRWRSRWPRHGSAKEEVIRAQLGQRGALLPAPRATDRIGSRLEYDPMLVRRLRRIRDSRARQRSARTPGFVG